MAARIGALIATVVLLLLVGTPAEAHGGASVTIHSDGHGSVWITAQWQDGHPITEPTAVTMTASADGAASLAPSVLRQTGDGRGTQTYSGTLDPGAWRVAIDLAAPVNGHCQALIQVASAAATPQPTEVACLIPASVPSAAAAPPASPAGGSLTPLWFTLGGLAVAAAVTAAVLVRRRS
ncbi:hypothetical protein ABT297_25905 [Dactylosporangium sp. NPDC000555]|uniref:hypothetical protein n=1 Tax=Dactylosporangium sp. NPDC000555 TaxID=3154260 RepID=UPI003326A903